MMGAKIRPRLQTIDLSHFFGSWNLRFSLSVTFSLKYVLYRKQEENTLNKCNREKQKHGSQRVSTGQKIGHFQCWLAFYESSMMGTELQPHLQTIDLSHFFGLWNRRLSSLIIFWLKCDLNRKQEENTLNKGDKN